MSDVHHSCIAVNICGLLQLMDVFNKILITEYVDGRSRVKENPVRVDRSLLE